MDFLKHKVAEATKQADRGDGEACLRTLQHAVAEDPGALDRICAAVDNLPPR